MKLPEILTMKQACQIINCSESTLRRWEKQGKIKAIRWGKRKDRRFKMQEIMRLVGNSDNEN